MKGSMPPPADEPELEDTPIEEAAEPQDSMEPMMMHGGGQVSPDVARYLPPDAVCANCIHFMEPNTCEIVSGAIEPQGRCSLFSADTEGAQEDAFELPPDEPMV